jgi:hypothetical protein
VIRSLLSGLVVAAVSVFIAACGGAPEGETIESASSAITKCGAGQTLQCDTSTDEGLGKGTTRICWCEPADPEPTVPACTDPFTVQNAGACLSLAGPPTVPGACTWQPVAPPAEIAGCTWGMQVGGGNDGAGIEADYVYLCPTTMPMPLVVGFAGQTTSYDWLGCVPQNSCFGAPSGAGYAFVGAKSLLEGPQGCGTSCVPFVGIGGVGPGCR